MASITHKQNNDSIKHVNKGFYTIHVNQMIRTKKTKTGKHVKAEKS